MFDGDDSCRFIAIRSWPSSRGAAVCDEGSPSCPPHSAPRSRPSALRSGRDANASPPIARMRPQIQHPGENLNAVPAAGALKPPKIPARPWPLACIIFSRRDGASATSPRCTAAGQTVFRRPQMPGKKRAKVATKKLHKAKKLEDTKAPLTFTFKLVAVKN